MFFECIEQRVGRTAFYQVDVRTTDDNYNDRVRRQDCSIPEENWFDKILPSILSVQGYYHYRESRLKSCEVALAKKCFVLECQSMGATFEISSP